jgi:argininosuccinate synthase
VRDFVFPMFRANAFTRGSTFWAPPSPAPDLQASGRDRRETGADAVAHGATGKGNDQVRFELGAYALNPDIKVIAPWREWDLTSRTKLIDFAEQNQIPIAKDKRGEAPFSVDANLLHTSSEGKVLEDPAEKRPITSTSAPCTPRMRPIRPRSSKSPFEQGDAVSINGEAAVPRHDPDAAQRVGRQARRRPARPGGGALRRHEKSRGIYETPGGTILLEAHRGIEQITLDRGGRISRTS